MIQSLVLLKSKLGRMFVPLNLIWEPTEIQCEEIRLDPKEECSRQKRIFRCAIKPLARAISFKAGLHKEKVFPCYWGGLFQRTKARASDL